jgi:hypothetical protein
MNRFTALAASLPCFLGMPGTAATQAQPDQPSEFLYVISVTVKPGAVPDYENFAKKIVAGANKIGAPQHWSAWSVSIGGPGRTYNIVLPFNKWSDIDGWTPVPQILTKAYGAAEGRRIMGVGSAASERSETAVYRLLPNLSTRFRAGAPAPAFVHLFVTEVEPRMVKEWEGYLAKLKGAQEKSPEGPPVIRRVSVLGAGNTYVTAVPFQKFAERDNWGKNPELMRDTYGQAQADSLDGVRLRSIRNVRQMVLMYRPELSRPEAPSTSATR